MLTDNCLIEFCPTQMQYRSNLQPIDLPFGKLLPILVLCDGFTPQVAFELNSSQIQFFYKR